ncbi:hypothetical protein B0T17DRAFT_373059 [Bombardia bombarda]|uniref:Uncharacterized protein n=1 Tax=Bombardia bombarda TaxID=252184 RepID=A0AA39WGG8_9PEZI|nr:hypothetical protein B0T17DRAFT_373059 [Bombardia bombarda]
MRVLGTRPRNLIRHMQPQDAGDLDHLLDGQASSPIQGHPSALVNAGAPYVVQGGLEPRIYPARSWRMEIIPWLVWDSWLDLEKEEQLFSAIFRTHIAPRFPFVVPSDVVTLQVMRQQRPFTHLAILAVASTGDFVLQRKLSGLFNQVVAARVAAGTLVSLDVLQGLLLHVAW